MEAAEQKAPPQEQPPPPPQQEQHEQQPGQQQQQQQQHRESLSWACPPRPPFARSGDEGIDNVDETKTATTSSSSSSSSATKEQERALAARYASKLVEVRAVVTDAHFRGKDLAGKAGGVQFACSRDPGPVARFLATPRLPAELEKWLDPSYEGGE